MSLDIGDRVIYDPPLLDEQHLGVVREVREHEPRILVRFDDPPPWLRESWPAPGEAWVTHERLRRVA